jgi:flagellar biosynthetic protein FliR
MQLDGRELSYAFLMFVRMSGHTLISPIFGHRSVPAPLKIGFALILSGLLLATHPPQADFLEPGLLTFVVQLLRETSIGLMIGFIAQVFISLTLTAGQIIDVELGLGIGSVLDPQNYSQSPVSGVLLNLLVLLYFLQSNGHLHLIRILAASLDHVPVGASLLLPNLGVLLVSQFALGFGLAVSLSLPLIGTALLVELVLGILARSIPQINAYMVGIPLKILLGLTVLLGLQSLLGPFSSRVFEQLFLASEQAVLLMGGGQ